MVPAGQAQPVAAQSSQPQVWAADTSGKSGGKGQQTEGVKHYDNLYVKGLPENSTEDTMKQMFGQNATVVSCRVLPSTPGKPDAAGFVRVATEEMAKNIIDTMNGSTPPGC